MMRLLYWALAAFVLAIAAHNATLLFAPSLALERNLSSAVKSEANHFAVLDKTAQAGLLGEFPPGSLFGLCRFDLSLGPVTLNADLPDTYWVFSVYSPSGETLYAINDRQTSTNHFTLKLVKAPTLRDMLTGRSAAEPDEGGDLAWRVSSPDRTGIALFWVPLADEAQRQVFSQVLAKTRCSSGHRAAS